MNAVKLPFYAKLALTLLAIVLILFIMMEGSTIFIPMVFALLIAVLLLPVQQFMERRMHMNRGLSSILSVILFVGCIAAFIYFMTLQIANFSDDFPQLEKRFAIMWSNAQHWISHTFHINTKQQTDYINKSVNGMVGTAAASVGNMFVSVGAIVLWTVFVFIYTFFMLFHKKLLSRFVEHLFSKENRPKVREVVHETRGLIRSYVLGLLTEMLILSIVNCTVFLIMGVKYAILLGVMASVLNIIPYLGIYTAAAIAMLVTFANGGGNAALGVGIALIIVHLLDSNVLMPRIVGSRVKMNPLITIIAVVVGEFIWGIPGMFLFIPITAILKLIFDRVDDLEAWAILIGTDDNKQSPPKSEKIDPDK